ncbi:MAG: imidazole glycerol phosphate synthase subunit HisH [Gammaproteobacteria bacterium]
MSRRKNVRVAIIDFAGGNLQSVTQAVRSVGGEPVLVRTPEQLLGADRAILPGVGAMARCMQALRRNGLDDAIVEFLRSRPLLGVCIGLQLLAQGSAENGGTTGLGAIPGQVIELPEGGLTSDGRRNKVPHMGWTRIQTYSNPCWKSIPDGSYFYFVHSYYLPAEERLDLAAVAAHNAQISAAVSGEHYIATQFHPEKSGTYGLQFYQNFLEWSP